MGCPGPGARRAARAGALLAVFLLALRAALLALPAALLALPAAALASSHEDAAGDAHWLALLHQARHRPDRATRASLTETGFYLHAEGARRPDLELEATVAAMTDPDAARARSVRCRYPARHAFLAERGRVPAERGACPDFDAWREQIGRVRATIVFPEAFLGNPSSMFGHTLLRFDPIDDEGRARSPLLGFTLDYAANPGDDRGALYLLRGMAGGYRGRFGIQPYYLKTRLYSDWQDRDIWEYPLAMAREDLDRVLLHVWELSEVELPYRFFTRNCSAYLLDVLEISWSGLGRGGGFPPTVTPIDTLRAMEERAPGSIGEPHFRPSPATFLQVALAALAPADAELVEALAEGRFTPDDERVGARPEAVRARVLQLAYDLAYHRTTARAVPTTGERERLAALLRARSRLPVATEADPSLGPGDRLDPLRGHGTSRFAVAAGIHDRDAFVEWRIQPAFHEAADAPGGFAEGGEIRFLDTRLRYYPVRERVRLHELVVVDVSAASPWRPPFRPLGWHFELGARTRMVSRDDGRDLEPDSFFRSQGGFGAAVAPVPRLLLYGFGEVFVEAGDAIEGNGVAGPLARVGASWSSRRGGMTLHVEAVAGGLLGRDPSEWLRVELSQRVTLTEKWSLTIGGHFERSYGVGAFEGRASLIRYF